MLSTIIQLRKELHQFPDLSGSEILTAQRIRSFINEHHPTTIIEGLGEIGLAAIYKFSDNGPVVAIRCELDALPIEEDNHFPHKSSKPGVSHKCGHDGHMAIVAGLIFWIKKQSFPKGKIILLFQPAEETGKGAKSMIDDEQFKALKIDYLFALHNIPGETMHSIIAIQNGFSAEVLSFSINVTGKESHAAEPENGLNPALGLAELTIALNQLIVQNPNAENFALLTPVYSKMGQKAYGISPAQGELHYTARTWSSEHMNKLKVEIEDLVESTCDMHELEFSISWFEHFPASQNNSICSQLIRLAADQNNYNLIERSYPFKFGEDFGWFSKGYKTAMFGLGAGLHTPALHNSDYDFPDEIIETGIQMFASIITNLLAP